MDRLKCPIYRQIDMVDSSIPTLQAQKSTLELTAETTGGTVLVEMPQQQALLVQRLVVLQHTKWAIDVEIDKNYHRLSQLLKQGRADDRNAEPRQVGKKVQEHPSVSKSRCITMAVTSLFADYLKPKQPLSEKHGVAPGIEPAETWATAPVR